MHISNRKSTFIIQRFIKDVTTSTNNGKVLLNCEDVRSLINGGSTMSRGGGASCCCCFVTGVIVLTILTSLSLVFYYLGFLMRSQLTLVEVYLSKENLAQVHEKSISISFNIIQMTALPKYLIFVFIPCIFVFHTIATLY